MKGLRFAGLLITLVVLLGTVGCDHYHHSEVMSETVVSQQEVVM